MTIVSSFERGARLRAALLGGTALALAASAPPACGAEAAAAAPAPVPAGAEGTHVEEVLVTARKKEERLIDVPVAANVVSGATLQHRAISDLTQVGLLVPQVSVDQAVSGNGAIITIRGIGSASVDGSIEQEVTVNIDGVPTSRGRILYQSTLDQSSVEILKGPQALYFGKNSPAGVISLNSTNPGHEFEGYAKAGYETNGEGFFGEFGVSVPFNDMWAARFAFRASDMVSGYFHDNAQPITDPAQLPAILAQEHITLPGTPYSEYPASSEQIGRVTLTFTPNDRFDANLKFLESNYQDRSPSGQVVNIHCAGSKPGSVDYGSLYVTGTVPYLIDPYGTCGLSTNNSNGTIPVQIADHYPRSHGGIPYQLVVSSLGSLTLNYHLPEHITLTSVTGFYQTRNPVFGNFDFTSYSLAAGSNDEYNTSWTQEFRASSSFAGPLNFTAGFFYEGDNRTFIQNGFIGYFPADPTTGQTNTFSSAQYFGGQTYSPYGELDWKILPDLDLSGGLRYTNEVKSGNVGMTYQNAYFPIGYPTGQRLIGSFTDNNVSPQVTLAYHIDPDMMVYGAFKEGFKSGGFSNPAIIPIAATVANQEFGQENVIGGEAGFKFQNLWGGLAGDLTLYDYTYKGLQLTSFNAATTSYFTQNAASATARGVELNLNYQVTGAFDLYGSAGYNHARYNNFDAAQCWQGQTPAEGCIVDPDTGGTTQNLSGQALARAPDWVLLAGATYTIPISNDWKLGLSGDVRYSSGYFLETNDNPYGYQNAYATLDLRARFYTDTWELAVIGSNLTNTLYGVYANDKPLGIRGDITGTLGQPRQITLQATRRF